MQLDLSAMFEVSPRPGLAGVRQHTGSADARGLRFGIVASRFNPDLTGGLVDGAVAALRSRGARAKDITVAWVSGAFEIPVVLDRLAPPAASTPSSPSARCSKARPPTRR